MDQSATAKYLAEKMNLPEKLIRDESEQKRIVQQISELANQPEAQPGSTPGEQSTE